MSVSYRPLALLSFLIMLMLCSPRLYSRDRQQNVIGVNNHNQPYVYVDERGQDALNVLSIGRGDMIIAPVLLGYAFITGHKRDNLKRQKAIEISYPYCFAARLENKHLIDSLDEELTNPVNYTTICHLQAKWLDSIEAKHFEQYYPGKLYLAIVNILGSLSLLSILLCVYYEKHT